MLGTTWWIPHWSGIPCGVGLFRVTGTLGAHLHAGSDTVPSGIPDAQTQTSNITDFTPHCQLGGLLRVAPSCKAHARTHSTLCEYRESRCRRLVPDVSTHITRFGSPCQCSAWPMRLRRVCMRASKVPHAGTIAIVPHEGTQRICAMVCSIHVSTQYRLCVPGVPV
jgi:hypothetical protein